MILHERKLLSRFVQSQLLPACMHQSFVQISSHMTRCNVSSHHEFTISSTVLPSLKQVSKSHQPCSLVQGDTQTKFAESSLLETCVRVPGYYEMVFDSVSDFMSPHLPLDEGLPDTFGFVSSHDQF